MLYFFFLINKYITQKNKMRQSNNDYAYYQTQSNNYETEQVQN